MLMAEMASVIENAVAASDLPEANIDVQVQPRMIPNPAGLVTVDIYPADPFTDETGAGFGPHRPQFFFTVRARLTTPDHDSAQDLLFDFMDVAHDLSVVAALEDDQTMGGYATSVHVTGPSGYRQYVDPGGQGAYLGVEWRAGVLRAYS